MSRVVQLVFALVLASAVYVANLYVAQERYEAVGSRPCSAGACVLTHDRRTDEYFWEALPPPPDRDIIPQLGS